jgi:serine/threonine protein kinase
MDPGPKEDLLLGKTINGRYRVLQKLGAGGMSVVYLAEQINIERKVALKVLHTEYARDEVFVRRFRQEAKLAASLNHRNVIQIYDFDQGEDGNLFIAMEYVVGRTLKELMRAGAPDIAAVVQLAIQIADGLAAAHRAGVIHRDIKPENIMVVGRGHEVKIMDFGIARLREADAATRLTRAGSIMGTPAYMAPEQIEGKAIGEKTDIYAFGIVLYEMLSHTVPFTAPTPAAVLIKHLKEVPPPLRKLRREIPAQMERIVAQALEKKPERRPANMEEMVATLRKAALELPSPSVKLATATPPLPNSATRAAPRPAAARTELQPTVALAHEGADVELLPEARSQQHIPDVFQTSGQESLLPPPIASTMALTQPVEAVARPITHWKWLLTGACAVPVIALAAWMALNWQRPAIDDRSGRTPRAAEPQSPAAKIMTAAIIRAERQELTVNERTALRLSAQYSDGTSEDVNDNVEWISSDPSVLSFAGGSAQARAAGTIQVSARYKGVEAGPIAIRVVEPQPQALPAPRLVSLSIQAAHHQLSVNGRLALHARGKYSDGKESEVKTVRWETSNSAVAGVNDRGEVVGQREGKVQVIARLGDVASEPVRLTVKSLSPGEPPRTGEKQPTKSIARKAGPNTARDEQGAKNAQTKEQIRTARLYRERGEYAQALAVLDKAGKIDPRNPEVQEEIAVTKRACNAERTLGRTDLTC